MAKPNNWNDARKELIAELQREPSSSDIQNRMLQSDLDDSNKVASKWKDKISMARTGKKHSEDSKLKMSKDRLEYYKKKRLENENNKDS